MSEDYTDLINRQRAEAPLNPAFTAADLKRLPTSKPNRGDPDDIHQPKPVGSYHPQGTGFGAQENSFPVKAIKGERREIDGCMRVVRLLFVMSNGKPLWVDYEDLLDEGNWTDV